MPTLDDLREQMKQSRITRVDLRVTDLAGRWRHFSLPASHLTDEIAARGLGFDGAAMRGFRTAEAADMLLRPDLETAAVDPLAATPTVAMIGDVMDPLREECFSRDPRFVARKAEEHLRSSGIADAARVGALLEFFIFDEARFQQAPNTGFYFVDSDEAHWNTGGDQGPNLAFKIPHDDGYGQVPPLDSLQPLRWAIAEALQAVGIEVEAHQHRGASAGQGSITTHHSTPVRKADETQWGRYLVRNIARAHGKTATFMPKPLHGDRGSGMHVHQSLWKDGQPLFHDSNGYGGLSRLARYYIAGLLLHAPALLALTAPSTNSYRRLIPGFGAPTRLTYSQGNRTAAIRIPSHVTTPAEQRIEFRPADGTANPYLAFAAMLMAGLDGIRRELDPGDAFDRNTDDLAPADEARLPSVPSTLNDALNALEADHAFLLEGDVFTSDVLDQWIAMKREEVRGLRERPAPYEFELYFNG